MRYKIFVFDQSVIRELIPIADSPKPNFVFIFLFIENWVLEARASIKSNFSKYVNLHKVTKINFTQQPNIYRRHLESSN